MSFYIAWFFKVYVASEVGWHVHKTPDDRPVAAQDSYFWKCLDIICQTLTELRIEALNREMAKNG